MNENNPYLKDVKVRRAIGMAIDVDQLIQGVFMGDAQRENGIIPTGVWAHNDAMKGFAYDPEGAKALLREAGYAEGEIKFELAMDSTANGARIVKAFVPLSEQFGYVTVLRTLSSGRATSTMSFDHYAEVPTNLAKEIVEKSGYSTRHFDDEE